MSPDESKKAAVVEHDAQADDEPTYSAERVLASAGDFAKAVGQTVRRGTVQGTLVMLAGERPGGKPPKELPRSEWIAAMKRFLEKEAT